MDRGSSQLRRHSDYQHPTLSRNKPRRIPKYLEILSSDPPDGYEIPNKRHSAIEDCRPNAVQNLNYIELGKSDSTLSIPGSETQSVRNVIVECPASASSHSAISNPEATALRTSSSTTSLPTSSSPMLNLCLAENEEPRSPSHEDKLLETIDLEYSPKSTMC